MNHIRWFLLLGFLWILFGIGANIMINAGLYLYGTLFIVGFVVINGYLGHRGINRLGSIGWLEKLMGRFVNKNNVKSQKQTQNQYSKKITRSHYTVKSSSHHLTDEEKEVIKQQAMQELDELVGMDEVKEQIKRFLNHISVEKERERRGMAVSPLTLHMLLLGEAGTGKTSVARIIGKFLWGAGMLSKGHFIETDREGLVGQHVGHTAIKTKEKINEAIGGVLFIDEAYSLNGSGNDFGPEAVSTLIKAMEDNKHNLVVIFAGYEKEMRDFIKMNSGLQSRIQYHFSFPDYNPYELFEIARRLMNKQGMRMDKDTQKALYHLVANVWLPTQRLNGNGRWIRNLVEQIRVAQNNRIATTGTEDYITVLVQDIEEAINRVPTAV